jgi:hypothetical protein
VFNQPRRRGAAHKRTAAALLLAMAPGACTGAYWRSYDLSLNPPQGVFQAKAECRMRAATASGYDWADAASTRRATFVYCMHKFGYRFEADRPGDLIM